MFRENADSDSGVSGDELEPLQSQLTLKRKALEGVFMVQASVSSISLASLPKISYPVGAL